MKKLGKSTLDELAKRMPVLCEKEQRSSIGGEKYYDISGNYLGSNGSTSEIRVSDRFIFDQLNNPYESRLLYENSS